MAIEEREQYRLGQYMTPPDIANRMAQLFSDQVGEGIILDPAVGSGNLLEAALGRFKRAGEAAPRLRGTEIDPSMIASSQERFADRDIDIELIEADFLLVDLPPKDMEDIRGVIANPPYGWNREYEFFQRCLDDYNEGTELVFLVPLSFLDRCEGLEYCEPLAGRPLGVTTGHAIVKHTVGKSLHFRKIHEAFEESRFKVLSGVKLYERGAGTPQQTAKTVESKPYSSSEFNEGWMPCVRTGDIQDGHVSLGRLWVDYGPHLAHPKTMDRFIGPRLFVRRVPIWKQRKIGSAYIDRPALCAGDVLVVMPVGTPSPRELRGLAIWLSGPEATELMHERRPTLMMRDSFPKFAAKDLLSVLESAPSKADLIVLSKTELTAVA